MPQFALFCTDKPESVDLRQQTRPAHVDYLQANDRLRLAGPTFDEVGQPNGSLLVIEVEDFAAAQAFSKGDPYAKAGLFASVEIRPFTRTLGSWG